MKKKLRYNNKEQYKLFIINILFYTYISLIKTFFYITIYHNLRIMSVILKLWVILSHKSIKR